MKKRVVYLSLSLGLLGFAMAAWTLTARAGYESAEYRVVESDGAFEVREYPDLVLASTESELDSQGRDGSFMRLFRYISGNNETEQSIAMTTPVFMESEDGQPNVSMGFVMPREVAEEGAPAPTGRAVEIRKREGGRFAVVRFAGQLNSKSARENEAKLRDWMTARGLKGSVASESAGYDPPFTPGPLRRNEVLIRLDSSETQAAMTRVAKRRGEP